MIRSMRGVVVMAGVLALAGCGGGARTGNRSSSTQPATANRAATNAAEPPGRAAGCPSVLQPGPRAAELATRALFRNPRRLFRPYGGHGANVIALLSLDIPEILPGISTRRLTHGPAMKACGKQVMNQSLGAVVILGSAPDADHSIDFVYLARTKRRGWRPWYIWVPNASPQGKLLK